MYELIKEFIKPELLILVPVLYLIGVGLKKSQIADKHIPFILGTISVVLSLVFIAATTVFGDWQGMLLAIFSGITQGVLCAGGSVYVNQVIKQAGKEE